MYRFNLSKLLFSFILYLGIGFAVAATDSRISFKQLLNEAGLVLNSANNLNIVKPQANSIQPYEYALRSSDAALEIRYAIRPLARVKIEYEDPHNSAPNPNHIFPLLFDTMLENLSKEGNTPKREYSPEQARNIFNADWANAAAFDVVPEFSKKYKQGLLVAMHKNTKADAYVIFLYNDYQKIKKIIDSSMRIVIFK